MTLTELRELEKRATHLIEHKGDMSVELWNDKAQCLMGSLVHRYSRFLDLAEAVREHQLAHKEQNYIILEGAGVTYVDIDEAREKMYAALDEVMR